MTWILEEGGAESGILEVSDLEMLILLCLSANQGSCCHFANGGRGPRMMEKRHTYPGIGPHEHRGVSVCSHKSEVPLDLQRKRRK